MAISELSVVSPLSSPHIWITHFLSGPHIYLHAAVPYLLHSLGNGMDRWLGLLVKKYTFWRLNPVFIKALQINRCFVVKMETTLLVDDFSVELMVASGLVGNLSSVVASCGISGNPKWQTTISLIYLPAITGPVSYVKVAIATTLYILTPFKYMY